MKTATNKTIKTNTPIQVLLPILLFGTASFSPPLLFAQGSLAPPGAPAPTMKSLAQIEPRTAITNSGAVTISQSGSYYLTTNITVSSENAVTIAANNVMLDLNGFTISSTAASAGFTGIILTAPGGNKNITIANGFIQGGVTNNGSGTYSGSGFGYGITWYDGPPVNVLVSRISISGCLYSGIQLNNGDSTVVDSCTVRTVGDWGINASTIKSSSAIDCGGYAIYGDQVSDCRGQSYNNGIEATTANNCTGSTSGSGSVVGISATTANNCSGAGSGNDTGIFATTANNCYGTSSNGIGIFATTANNCSGTATGNGTGLSVSGVAIGCYGSSSPTGVGINANIANSCVVGGGTTNINHKYNMP